MSPRFSFSSCLASCYVDESTSLHFFFIFLFTRLGMDGILRRITGRNNLLVYHERAEYSVTRINIGVEYDFK